MDFNKLIQYGSNIKRVIYSLSEKHKYTFEKMQQLCREIAYQTPFSMTDAIRLVNEDLSNGLCISKIKEKYNVKY